MVGLGLLASSASAFLLPASTVVARAASSTRPTALQVYNIIAKCIMVWGSKLGSNK